MIGCEDSHDIANNNLSKWGVTITFTGTWIEPQVYSLMQSLNLRMALKYVCLARNADNPPCLKISQWIVYRTRPASILWPPLHNQSAWQKIMLQNHQQLPPEGMLL